eukprot:scaffold10003_cov117-Isochrysis_galbana.AAC.7
MAWSRSTCGSSEARHSTAASRTYQTGSASSAETCGATGASTGDGHAVSTSRATSRTPGSWCASLSEMDLACTSSAAGSFLSSLAARHRIRTSGESSDAARA